IGSLAGIALVVAASFGGPAGANSGRAPVPTVLIDVESSAEDIVDDALAGNRDAVVATAGTLRRSASGPAASALRSTGVPKAVVRDLARRANRVALVSGKGSMISVALAANDVSGLMPTLYAHFSDRVPPTILKLDYLDREAE